MRLVRPSALLRLIYPQGLFRLRTKEKKLVLTFDDGPDPESTPHLLKILDDHQIKGVFFCTGNKAEKYTELVRLLRSKGHITGNHGHEHLNGWKVSCATYLENVRKASGFTSGDLFRPPYGLLRPSQYRELIKTFRIVFWDIMPYDFDKKLKAKECLEILRKKIRPGSVIVMHDTVSSSLLDFIEEFIVYARKNGYSFVTEI